MARPRISHESILRIRHKELSSLTIFQVGMLIKLASMAAISSKPGYVCSNAGASLLEYIAGQLKTTYQLVSKNVELLQNAGFVLLSDEGLKIIDWGSRWTDSKSNYQRELMRKRRGFVSLTNGESERKLEDEKLGSPKLASKSEFVSLTNNMLANKRNNVRLTNEQNTSENSVGGGTGQKNRTNEQSEVLNVKEPVCYANKRHRDYNLLLPIDTYSNNSKEKEVVKGKEDDPRVIEIVKELSKLRGWVSAPKEDINFVYQFMTDYPTYDLTISEIHQIENFHIRRHTAHNKGNWKNRLHNWAKSSIKRKELENEQRSNGRPIRPTTKPKREPYFKGFKPIIAGTDEE